VTKGVHFALEKGGGQGPATEHGGSVCPAARGQEVRQVYGVVAEQGGFHCLVSRLVEGVACMCLYPGYGEHPLVGTDLVEKVF